MPKPLQIIVYPVFAILTFFLFVLMLFPVDSIKARLISAAEQGLGGRYNVEIRDMSMSPFSGVGMEKVVVTQKGGDKLAVLKLEQATVDISIMPLLWGSVQVDFDVDVDGGSLTGEMIQSGGALQIDADMKNFNVAGIPYLEINYGIPLSSNIDGTIDMEIFPQAPLRNNGSIKLAFKNLKLGESNIKGVFPLPSLLLAAPEGKSDLDVVMNRGNIEVRSFKLKGGDLDIALDGKITLAQKVSNFRINLRGKVGFSKKVEEELPILAMVEKQKGEDGLYPIKITGRLNKPKIEVGDFKLPF